MSEKLEWTLGDVQGYLDDNEYCIKLVQRDGDGPVIVDAYQVGGEDGFDEDAEDELVATFYESKYRKGEGFWMWLCSSLMCQGFNLWMCIEGLGEVAPQKAHTLACIFYVQVCSMIKQDHVDEMMVKWEAGE